MIEAFVVPYHSHGEVMHERGGEEHFESDAAARARLCASLRARGVEVSKDTYPCQKLVPTKQTKVKS